MISSLGCRVSNTIRNDRTIILQSKRQGKKFAKSFLCHGDAFPFRFNFPLASRFYFTTKHTKLASSSSKSSHSGMTLYDSLTERIQPLPESLDEASNNNNNNNNKKKKALAWYTCGPTTYAPAHMGHARTYVWIDIMRRVIEHNYEEDKTSPLFVMNITDVDDKILAAAAASANNEDATQLSRRMEAEFWRDLDALNCLRPHIVTRVTEYVETDIIPYIQRLKDLGMAYEAEDGVYFHVRAYNDRLGHITKYGKLAPPAAAVDIEITQNNNNNNNNKNRNDDDNDIIESKMQKKNDPRDFVLWKKRKAGEQLWWPSPFGDGRPGWHIECSAMIEAVQKRFQDTHQFLVHAGGIDLKFPHHANEIAQSEAYRESEWIPHWVHTGHLHIDGLKMSKSLKNFVTIEEFLTEFGSTSSTTSTSSSSSSLESPADDFRLWCLGLSGKYRGPATFSRTRIMEARTIREKIIRFLISCEERISHELQQEHQQSTTKIWNEEDQNLFLVSDQTKQVCLEALRNDLDGSKFVEQIVSLAEYGLAYLKDRENCPIELLQAISKSTRSLLALVGFSDKTVRAGITLDVDGRDSSTSNVVVGGERAVIDSFVEFRSLVRNFALDDMAAKTNSENTKKILQLCDEYRDSILPSMGVETQDGLSGGESKGWRYCFPKPVNVESESKEDQTTPSNDSIDLYSVPLKDFFRVGQYEGMFSEFSEEGIPIHNADGTEISKRALKKLLKKYEAHKKRLEQSKTDEKS